MPAPKSILVLLLPLLRVTTAVDLNTNVAMDNAPNCTCFLVDGPSPGYFQHHRFWDFRNILPDGDDNFTVAPPLIMNNQSNGSEFATSSYFRSTDFTDDWTIQTWRLDPDDASPISRVNSAQNVYITRGDEGTTYLNLRASRTEDFMSSSELDNNQKNLFHSSIRIRFRVIPNDVSNSTYPGAKGANYSATAAGSNASHPVDEGVVVGFFTYESDTSESDIEIRTLDPTTNMRWSNQPDYNARTDTIIQGASTDIGLPEGLMWTQWLDHRLDWFPGRSSWYVNDQLMLNKSYGVPKAPSGVILNVWGDGGQWSGNMSIGGSVVVAIEWIEYVFNTSGPIPGPQASKRRWDTTMGLWRRKEQKCQLGCKVDGVQVQGVPELAFNSSMAAGLVVGGKCSSGTTAILLAIIIGFAMTLS